MKCQRRALTNAGAASGASRGKQTVADAALFIPARCAYAQRVDVAVVAVQRATCMQHEQQQL